MAVVTRRFATSGMHCRSCSTLVELEVGDLPGVASVSSDHARGVTEVTYDESAIGPDEIVHAVTKVGYGAELLEE